MTVGEDQKTGPAPKRIVSMFGRVPYGITFVSMSQAADRDASQLPPSVAGLCLLFGTLILASLSKVEMRPYQQPEKCLHDFPPAKAWQRSHQTDTSTTAVSVVRFEEFGNPFGSGVVSRARLQRFAPNAQVKRLPLR